MQVSAGAARINVACLAGSSQDRSVFIRCRKTFEQGVRGKTVQDRYLLNAIVQALQAALDLGKHATGNRSFLQANLCLRRRKVTDPS